MNPTRKAVMPVTRRELAKGTMWATPVILASSAAPAIAASPCAVYKTGQPLPASAFTATYFAVTNETLGGSFNKQVAVAFGFRMSDEAQSCGVRSGSINSTNSGGTSYFRLSNGSLHPATNGGSVPANGSVGVIDNTCRSGLNGTAACGTSGQSAYDVKNSTNTDSLTVTGVSLYRSITVGGYGTTVLYINASDFRAGNRETLAQVLTMTSGAQFYV